MQNGIQNIIERKKMNKDFWTEDEYEGFIDDER